jgi:hypothetical protein
MMAACMAHGGFILFHHRSFRFVVAVVAARSSSIEQWVSVRHQPIPLAALYLDRFATSTWAPPFIFFTFDDEHHGDGTAYGPYTYIQQYIFQAQ